MQGKIALEEHILAEGFHVNPDIKDSELRRRIFDTEELRLAEMDRSGIELAVLSLSSPGVQIEVEASRGLEEAARANDLLADIVAAHPDRYRAFASVPLQDPEHAADELERSVTELGFPGAMVNGYTNTADPDTGEYYDHPKYDPFWERVQALAVPVYLHPRISLPAQQQLYGDFPFLLSAAWGFGVETGTHAIRLILSGLFDRYPNIQIILGHLGETLPFTVWRLEHWFALRGRAPLRRSISDCLRENFHVTTSGNFASRALVATLLELGAERVLFSVDYPYESMTEAAAWFDSAPINPGDRLRIGRTNAERLLRLR